MMFPVIINDGTAEIPDSDIYYIVGKEGVFLKKKLGVMESIAPVKNISILESVQSMARMHIRKIPAKKAKQILNFFKAVYEEHYSEAIVLLFYNMEKQHYKVVVPVQEVSGGAADYNKAITIDGYDMIGTIHSHAGMSAFHSGTDDDDEKSFDGLHITFGNMRDKDISVSASIVANGHRIIVDPSEYINNIEMTVDIDEEEKVPMAQTWRWDKDQHKMVQVKSEKFYTRRKFDQRYQIHLAKDPKFPANWMERVTKKTYVSQYAGTGWAGGWQGHNAGYDSDYWKDWKGHGVQANKPGTVTPTKQNKTTPATVPNKPTVVSKETPCDACSFKHHKINLSIERMDDETKKAILAWAIEKLEGNNYQVVPGEEVDETGLTHYHCAGCQEYISVDENTEGSACCPNCQTDDYLIEVSSQEIMMEVGGTYEEDDSTTGNMIKCEECGSSFTEDFLNDGHCPTCNTLLPVEVDTELDASDDIVICPDCFKENDLMELAVDNKCFYCSCEISPYEIAELLRQRNRGRDPLENQMDNDSGAFLDPEKEAIERIAQDDIERIPVPDSDSTPITKTKTGVFASIFEKAKALRKG